MADYKLWPSILPGEDFVDDSYTRSELEGKEYPELKSIAAEHPSEDVHGQMTHDELLERLEGLERV